jgi:hypothetical protein
MDEDLAKLLSQDWVVDGVKIDPSDKVVVVDQTDTDQIFFGDVQQGNVDDEFPDDGYPDDMMAAIGFKGQDTMNDTKIEKRNMNPKDRWLVGVREAIQNMNGRGINITKVLSDEIIDSSNYVNKFEYMNPTKYVAGRLAIVKGKISGKAIEEIHLKIPTDLLKADIVRYSRWWINEMMD